MKNLIFICILIFIFASCTTIKTGALSIDKNGSTMITKTDYKQVLVDSTSGLKRIYSKQFDTVQNSSLEIQKLQDFLNKNNTWKKLYYFRYHHKHLNSNIIYSFGISNDLNSDMMYLKLYPNEIRLTKWNSKHIPIVYFQYLNDSTFNFIPKLFN